MVSVGIVGASGYTGFELIRLLLGHPEVKITIVSSRTQDKAFISDHYPAFKNLLSLSYTLPEAENIAEKAEFVFMALPHGASLELVPDLLNKGIKIVDLSADYRLKDENIYRTWYGDHNSPALLKEAVYGLPELYRPSIKRARLTANPGCYPTSIILALAPLLRNNLIETDSIIADSKSGVTGAGRGLSLATHFCEVNENFKAYKVGGSHRHIPEIEQELSSISGKDIKITFTPHLVPMSRGILSTIYVHPKEGIKETDFREAFMDLYQNEPFVRLYHSKEEMPSTLQVRGSNFCDIGFRFDTRTGKVVVVSAIDNLTRGASGQAVCNMNIMLGFPETMALHSAPWQP